METRDRNKISSDSQNPSKKNKTQEEPKPEENSKSGEMSFLLTLLGVVAVAVGIFFYQ
jgi:hypothetical protein